MSKKGIRALVYVSLVSVAIWGATGYLVMEAVRVLCSVWSPRGGRRALVYDYSVWRLRAPGIFCAAGISGQ